MSERTIQLIDSWKEHIGEEFQKEYMIALREFLLVEKKKKRVIYPKGENIFLALNTTPLEKVRVVILGQDPYHGPNQAHGLCFSVNPGIDTPPSLQNIYKELNDDLGVAAPKHGCLLSWAQRGALLLNSVLTVEAGRAASHANHGWETFTDKVIEIVNNQREGVAFLLWGSYARKKGETVNRAKHLVLTAPHPSPLSAHRGFLGCRHFSQTNSWFAGRGEESFDWRLPDVV